MNIMKQPRIEKLTLNVGAGTDQELLKKGMKLLKNLTGTEPVKTITSKRIPAWGIRPGLPVGCKLTMRGHAAEVLLTRLLVAKENKLLKSCFDNMGNVSFGIHEYINVPELSYDAAIGIMGFQACVTIIKPGYRIKNRRKLKRKIGKSHNLSQEESIQFFKEKFKIHVEEN